MQAGFARIDITPPKGTPLMGWGSPATRLSTGVHDPLFVRALAMEHEGEEAIILGIDLCFVARDDAERWHGILTRETGLLPRQVMFSATHTHAAPAVGNYMDLKWLPPMHAFREQLDAAVMRAIHEARHNRRPATLRAGKGKTTIPMNRRKSHNGKIVNGPNPQGPTYDALPVCLIEDEQHKPVCLLFSASTHPVAYRAGDEVSADYPGVAMARLDKQLGTPCSLFLQGLGGDSRPAALSKGETWAPRPGEAEIEIIGGILANETLLTLDALRSSKSVTPRIRTALVTAEFPLTGNLTREDYTTIAQGSESWRAHWAKDQLALLERNALTTTAPILFQGITLGENVRLVAVEGEPLHHFGAIIESRFTGGITIPLGYINGEGMYLPSTAMLAEGGYEPESFWEYHKPSALAPGMERVIERAVDTLISRGIV